MPYLFFIFGCFGLIISGIGLYLPALQQLDVSVVTWMSLQRNPVVDVIAISLSMLGGLAAVLLISGLCCLWQARSKHHANILFICLGISGSAAIGWALKFFIHRPRPDMIEPLVHTYGASFPSAHSLYAAVLAAIAIFIGRQHSQSWIIIWIASLWWIVMGLSRVYLGAHYPTDVLAGWSIGFIWTGLLWFAFQHTNVFKIKLDNI